MSRADNRRKPITNKYGVGILKKQEDFTNAAGQEAPTSISRYNNFGEESEV